MTVSKLEKNLKNLFEQYRIVFWYDGEQEFSDEFKALNLDSIEKVTCNGNPFYVKHLVSNEQSEQKFLLYFPHEQPKDQDNWLLDLQLAHKVYHSDPAGLVLQELGLPFELKPLVDNHKKFFDSKARNEKFLELYNPKDSYDQCLNKMLSVTFNTIEVDLQGQLLQFITQKANGKEDQIENELERFELRQFFWDKVAERYDYAVSEPSLYDFLLTIFKEHFPITRTGTNHHEAKILLSRWKQTKGIDESFKHLSKQVQEDLDIDQLVSGKPIDELVSDDLFERTDREILSSIVSLLLDEDISDERVQNICRIRSNKFWYSTFKPFYEAVEYASLLIHSIRDFDTNEIFFNSLEDGAKRYSESLYQVDFYYRKFVFNYRLSKQSSILKALADKIERMYSNDWLLNINQKWQHQVDTLETWPSTGRTAQADFYNQYVKPFVDKQQRVIVVISDALRYEAGRELFQKMISDHRFVEDDFSYMISSLPSYTQLGMASLLPYSKLEIKEGGDTVESDGNSTVGQQAREKILKQIPDIESAAISAEAYMEMHSKKEGRDFTKAHDLIYIYHNIIDKTGDDRDSEQRVFEAVEEELEYLINLLVRINTIMAHTNVLVTSDHGFLYQNEELHESDFAVSEVDGKVWKSNRRFVLGKGLKGNDSFTHFKGGQLGLQEDLDVLIPKSINRLRVRGAGSRFVHGGASIQEVLIPVMKVGYKAGRQAQLVEIDIIKKSDRISSNLLPVSFIQTEPVSDKVLPRTLKAAIYTEEGTKLSDEFKFTFDFESGSQRNREEKYTFHLSSAASEHYGEWIVLRLEEEIKGSSQWKKYKEFRYQLVASQPNDFDL
ncbi:BREX-1 system phosphatase PglZ type A [Gracilimonas sp.]|uniref:BREX-1 system phosphatase PglZ type A n=1 Tax=Gracilimonas sp. TaxID=1974203 RepID=UPI003D0F2291